MTGGPTRKPPGADAVTTLTHSLCRTASGKVAVLGEIAPENRGSGVFYIQKSVLRYVCSDKKEGIVVDF